MGPGKLLALSMIIVNYLKPNPQTLKKAEWGLSGHVSLRVRIYWRPMVVIWQSRSSLKSFSLQACYLFGGHDPSHTILVPGIEALLDLIVKCRNPASYDLANRV